MSNPAAAKSAFDLKSTAWTLTALRLQTAHLPTLLAALDERFGATPGLFDHDAVVLDFSSLRELDAPPLELPPLLAALRRHGLMPVAVQGASAAQTAAAQAAGLAEALEAAAGARAPAATAAAVAVSAAATAPTRPEPPRMMQPVELREVVHEVVREVEVVKEVPTSAMVIDKPLRSGQRVYARHTDLVVMAMVSFGAEVIADGNVHVYGPLRGRAIAGARGNTQARIFSTCCEPQLVSIAGIYRAIETPESLPVHGKPAQVRLDGERILFEPL